MSTILKSSEGGGEDFEPHPPGAFMAVLADVFVKQSLNKYKGQIQKFGKNKGKPDERETIERVCFSFVTDEPIEIDGELKPRYASFWAPAGMGTAEYPSNARKFVKDWWPTLTDIVIDAGLDLDKFIGRGAYLTITQSTDAQGKVWANVTGAMQPPKGSSIPQIPADYVRYKDKPKADAAPAATAPAAQPQRHPNATNQGPLKLAPENLPQAPPHTLADAPPDNSLPELDKHEEQGINPW